jgi:hypothetical protein
MMYLPGIIEEGLEILSQDGCLQDETFTLDLPITRQER